MDNSSEINENSIVNGLLWTLRRELDENGDVKINVSAGKTITLCTKCYISIMV